MYMFAAFRVMSANPEESFFSACVHHPEKRCNFYCPQCDEDVCEECIRLGGGHHRHDCITKKDMAKKFHQDFKKELSLLHQNKKRLKQEESSKIERETMLRQNYEELRKNIRRSYDAVLQAVERKMNEDVENFQQVYEAGVGLKELSHLTHFISKRHDEVLSIEKRASQYDGSSDDVHFMESKKDIFSEMKKANVDLDHVLHGLTHPSAPFGETPVLGLGVVEAVQQKVSEMYKFADPKKMELSFERLHVNELVKITITVYDSYGQLCLVPQKVCFKLQSIRSPGKYIEAEVKSCSPSLYVVEFSPQIETRGRCLLEVGFDPINNTYKQKVFVECPFMDESLIDSKNIEAPGCLHRIKEKIYIIQGYGRDRCIMYIDTSCQPERMVVTTSNFKAPEIYKHWCPIEMASSENFVYVTDSNYNMVHQYENSTGNYVKSVGGKGTNGGKFNGPNGLCVTNEVVYICDSKNHRIQVFSLHLEFIHCFGSIGKREGQLKWPSSIAFDEKNKTVIVTERKNNRVQFFMENGQHLKFIGNFKSGPGLGRLDEPNIISIAENGMIIYVTDRKGVSIFKVTGEFIAQFAHMCPAKGMKAINGFAIDEDGYKYVSDEARDRIVVL